MERGKRTSPLIFAAAGLLLATGAANANTVASSTIYFEGYLTDLGGGIRAGTIAATAGTHYSGGGFDGYAKQVGGDLDQTTPVVGPARPGPGPRKHRGKC